MNEPTRVRTPLYPVPTVEITIAAGHGKQLDVECTLTREEYRAWCEKRDEAMR